MIYIHLNCRLELYAYITLKNNHVIHAVADSLYSQPTVPVQDGGHTNIFRSGNSQGLHILLKEVVCMMNICHIQMNRDKINSRGESTDFLNSKPNGRHPPSLCQKEILLTAIARHCPCSRVPFESRVVGHSRFALNQAQNTPWHMLQMYPPLLNTNTSTFTSRDRGEISVWAKQGG